MDFFSNLPDELVCHILSFLTTTEAASTSVLSKRWSNLFALVPNIDFEDTVFWSYDCKKTPSSFIDFVDRVMALQGDSPIKKFSLKCQSGRVDSGRVNSWICNWGTGREDTFFPMLKTLVFEVTFIDCGKMDMFLQAFPVLEELCIDATKWTVCDETVSSDTLRKLTIKSYGFGSVYHPRSISFDTPRLVYFNYADYVAEDYPKVNFTNLVEALLDLTVNGLKFMLEITSRGDEDHVFLRFRNVSKLMSGIRHVQKLYLSSDTLEVLSLRYESIPVFNNLKVLCIRSSAHGGWQAMPELLRSCPLLETLVLKGLLHYVTDKCGDACDCISREDKGRSLISCPVRKLQIERLQRTKRELEMIKHFLESFRCVKEVEIYAEENNLVDYLQVPREFELFNELYSCDVRFLARGSLHKTWTTVYCTTNQVVKEENFS
ncbi:putative F-box protein At3g58950 isoform X1 [Capsella rubella]|uniref:putative F-box protein At3g58950 isoform X1 n=1 Tax=Capsella rubella TaxID=81985 RepID=UPI000CD54698|nr:putative F-box protein At3g58950 isoform X1 [Capsella rubella]